MLGPPGSLMGGIAGSILGYLKADDYDGCILAICKLDDDQKKILMKRVGQVLIASGATMQQLNSAEAFRESLVSFASRRSVQDDLWNACIQSLQE